MPLQQQFKAVFFIQVKFKALQDFATLLTGQWQPGITVNDDAAPGDDDGISKGEFAFSGESGQLRGSNGETVAKITRMGPEFVNAEGYQLTGSVRESAFGIPAWGRDCHRRI